VTIEEARDWLRVSGTDNDAIIQGLLNAAPSYIESATGISADDLTLYPLSEQVTKFLLLLWYNADQVNADQLQGIIDNLLKSLTTLARGNDQ
jgi:hypothetical protein